MTEYPVVYQARWVGNDYAGLPPSSVAQMRADDVAARREAEEMASRAADQADAVVFRMRGVDTSLAGVFARAERGFAATDYRDERQAVADRVEAGDAAYIDGPPGASRSSALSDDDLRAAAIQARSRRVDREAADSRAASDAALAQARAAHPAARAWPAWGRRS